MVLPVLQDQICCRPLRPTRCSRSSELEQILQKRQNFEQDLQQTTAAMLITLHGTA